MANHLLLIAIGVYRDWPVLTGPPKDAERLKAVLYSRYGFAPERTVELRDRDATAEAVLAALGSLARRLRATDDLLIYFAGHGDSGDAGSYWITHEASTKAPEKHPREYAREGRIHHAEVRSMLGQMHPRHVLLVCDSCFGGDLFEKRNLAPAVRPAGWLEIARRHQSREILTSGAKEPVADSSHNGHSPFAYHLLKTLEDFSDDGLDPRGLHDYIRRGVKGQTPLYGPLKDAGHADGGAFLFVPCDPSPQSRLADERLDRMPRTLRPKASSPRMTCPACGTRNAPGDTFKCRACKRDFLCREHFVEERQCCEKCVNKTDTKRKRNAGVTAPAQKKIAYSDGARYEGGVVRGKRSGKGWCYWPDGSFYIGEWQNDKMNGQGRHYCPDGGFYIGEWRNNKRSGQGKYYWPDGSRYDGEWQDHRMNGCGRHYWPDGGTHVDTWKDGRKNGVFNYYRPGNCAVILQTWVGDVLVAPGT